MAKLKKVRKIAATSGCGASVVGDFSFVSFSFVRTKENEKPHHTTIHSSIPRVAEEKFTPILKSLLASLAKGSA